MSPLFAALPPADLPTQAYVAPLSAHSTAPLSLDLLTQRSGTYTVRPGDTLYGIAAQHGTTVSALARANGLTDTRMIYPGQQLRLSGGSAAAAPAPSSAGASSSSSGGTVTVRPGDTLSGIAARHGTTVSALARANGITDTRLIYPGQQLRLSGGSAGGSSTGATPRSSGSAASASGGVITVRAGDTLYDLAARHGTTVSALARANGLDDTRLIYPGQQLRLTGGGGAGTSSSRSSSGGQKTLSRPYDESTIGDLKAGEAVPSTFLHYTYADGVARSAAANREYLASVEVPSRSEMRALIASTAQRYGVDPTLMVALSYQESGWNHRAVSPANAIGAMQVIPSSGDWASALVGRQLNLLDPQDNVTAGVVIMRALLDSAGSTDLAIGSYYQGLGSVRAHGLFNDTRQYVTNIRHLMTTL